MDTISHHTHPHPLKPAYFYLETQWCYICREKIKGEAYYCKSECENRGGGFAIHEECAKLEEEVRHPFHPHSLTLRPMATAGCSLCKNNPIFCLYNCTECDFWLDVRCVFLSPAARDQIHDLNSDSLIPCKGAKHCSYTCNVCEQPIEGSMLYMNPKSCKFLHESCANLPKEIEHPFHSSHRLSLLRTGIDTEEALKCNACGRTSSTCFSCLQCRFYLDPVCAFLVPRNENTFESGHEHPLIQCDQSSGISIPCNGCGQPCLDSVYVCIQCGFVLDRSCAALPRQVTHVFDWQHNLILRQNLTSHFECDVCLDNEIGFQYTCLYCPLQIGITCAWPIPLTIKSEELHHHPLVFFQKPRRKFHCCVCKQQCISPFFLCFQCKYYIHLHCFPDLPSTIKHELHRHPLAFTNSPVKDFPEEDEDAELYCNVCEQRRKLVDPTYYCADCHFVAHVHCLTSQILSYLGATEKKSEDDAESSKANATTDAENQDSDGYLIMTNAAKELADGEVSEIERLEKEINKEAIKLEALLKRRDEKVNSASLIASTLDFEYTTYYTPPELKHIWFIG